MLCLDTKPSYVDLSGSDEGRSADDPGLDSAGMKCSCYAGDLDLSSSLVLSLSVSWKVKGCSINDSQAVLLSR